VIAIDKKHALVELGCGNGRDAFYFAANAVPTIAIDLAEVAIQQLVDKTPSKNPDFICADFTNLETPYPKQIGTVYSRFTLHAIKAPDASRTLKWSYDNLMPGGLLLIEVRSVKDPMCGKGTQVEGERDAWVNTHYRRFIRKDELFEELRNLGYQIEFELEADNVSVYKDDNPVVIRVHARKPARH